MNIHVLGAHNCESQNSRFVSLVIDDVLALDAGGLSGSLSFLAQQELKAILLTHHHYDHIRDIPAIAMNFFLQGAVITLYSTQTVYDALTTDLLNGRLYPKFLQFPETNPTVKFVVIEPYQHKAVEGYDILAVPVNHVDTAVGYQITSPDGKVVFYTGDTGSGLGGCWEHVSPQLLIIEVTIPDSYQDLAERAKHLTPSLLSQELASFRRLKGYLPQVIVVHMNPNLEKEIEAEIAVVAKEQGTSIALAHEGLQFRL